MDAQEPQDDNESWVQCDRCNQWRRVPHEVADALQENEPWYGQLSLPVAVVAGCAVTMYDRPQCVLTMQRNPTGTPPTMPCQEAACQLKRRSAAQTGPDAPPSSFAPPAAHRYCEANPHAEFASCDVPQEMTNEEIDDSGESTEEDDSDGVRDRSGSAACRLHFKYALPPAALCNFKQHRACQPLRQPEAGAGGSMLFPARMFCSVQVQAMLYVNRARCYKSAFALVSRLAAGSAFRMSNMAQQLAWRSARAAVSIMGGVSSRSLPC